MLTTEIFLFVNFVKNVDFERSQLHKVNVALSEFYLFVLSSLRVLGESYFEAPKVPLDK